MLAPENNPFFTGHDASLKNLAKILGSGRAPHAFLLGGMRGIGKATLAYRLARFIINRGLERGDNLFGAPEINLQMNPENPIFAKISHGSHPDLLALKANPEEEKKEITVEDVRKISGFLRMSSAESGWRVVIIDSIDEMNRNATNALLKILEEPTAKSILILISHSPGRLLPTIRSRSSVVKMHPLPEEKIREIFTQSRMEAGPEEMNFAIMAADGAPGLALLLARNDALAIYRDFLAIITLMPEPDISKIIEFGESVSGKNQEEWYAVNYLIGWFLNRAAKYSAGVELNFLDSMEKEAATKLLAVSSAQKLTNLASSLQEWYASEEIFHLDRRAIITNIFNLFKKAA